MQDLETMKFGNVVIKKHPNLDLLISNDGWVYIPKQKLKPPKWTKGCVSKSTGYCQLYHNRKCLLVHRLMAETFICNPNNYEEVDHIDRNRSNNVIENLRWASKKMNRDNQENVIKCLKKYGARCCDADGGAARRKAYYRVNKKRINAYNKEYYLRKKKEMKCTSRLYSYVANVPKVRSGRSHRGTQGEAGERAGYGLHRERGRGNGEPQTETCTVAGEGLGS